MTDASRNVDRWRPSPADLLGARHDSTDHTGALIDATPVDDERASRNVDPAEVLARATAAHDSLHHVRGDEPGVCRCGWRTPSDCMNYHEEIEAHGQHFDAAVLAALSEHFILVPRDSESFEKMVEAGAEALNRLGGVEPDAEQDADIILSAALAVLTEEE